MLAFLTKNLGTIIVGLVVAGIVAAIIVKLVRDKRQGKHIGCDCGCGGCPGSTSCDTKQ
ncbi:MAG: FeoB-associated Cys-rich membrane protein [Clostridiaceae bacterium]|jgi:1-aminocyclopropane-1-carboxylate deaminase/D-cysteine desulfhydrase-like pyridoxal-dependent ACC family enzyme|nr:FeoB-associated Cys-rich membrane protein [Clostridiaceae bacterium]